ncbi:molybdopterin molybdotransferase MoeA [Streptomyces flavofungini]|uniref:molybdopterin molybdotransferase MoeA n=1 Tax=Streptomyces flavofungini TaxID=68200 RepID=UPI0025AFB747|nr:molybdopterin molybdotransferase MoeA [Streptomyces flavofungini]WJV47422.1 molybdopterin-binding protein [Streptomyces flavofungini]
MSGQNAADAEFDEALALVNEDRARAGAGAAQPTHSDGPDHPDRSRHAAHPDRSGHSDHAAHAVHPDHPDTVEPADVPATNPRTPGTQRTGPAAQSAQPAHPGQPTPPHTTDDPLTPPGGWPPAPADHPTGTGAWPDDSGPPATPSGARANTSGAHHTGSGARQAGPGGPPAAGGHRATPKPRPDTPAARTPITTNTPSPQASAPPASEPPASAPPMPHTRATPWPEARAIARRAGTSAASPASPATSAPPPMNPSGGPVPPPAPAGLLPLPQTLGRTLSTPLTALTDLPSFDTSAMDGWAVAGPGPWGVLAEGILAGQGSPEPLGDGEAVRIATGARIPRDTTAVIRSEHGHVDSKGRLHAQREVVPGQDIRPRGQECRAGERLLPVGTLVTPAVLGLAAAAGYDALCVAARPRAEVLVLGDELLTEGLPQDGLIRDALGPMLPPWLRALGAEVTAVRRLGDDAEALYEALATSTADVLVTTGGTASGPVDHVHPTLRRLGAELLVDGAAVRPGHPMLLARLPGAGGARGADGGGGAHGAGVRHLVGLPGNPLAAVSGLLTLAEPLLRGLASRPAAEPYAAPLREDVHGHPHDTRLVPVTLRGEYAVPLHYNGPAMLRGIAVADGLAVVPPGGGRRGQELEILDLPWTEPGGDLPWTEPGGDLSWTEAGGLPGELGTDGPDDEVCFT